MLCRISAEGVLPNHDNLAKIKQWLIPTKTTQVMQILEMVFITGVSSNGTVIWSDP